MEIPVGKVNLINARAVDALRSPSIHSNRRYTRFTNAFSKKIENHSVAVALSYFAYNLIKIHQTLRCTPAMAASERG
jgi:hypothetical protein